MTEERGDGDKSDLMAPTYDRTTLFVAAAIFIGFCLFIFFLPQIMLAIGGENRLIAGAMIGVVLILPFAGLWLRGRIKAKSTPDRD
ncbi:MAG: hypothetical protein AAFP99_12190 [Pseudomonadota bacterium]